MKEKLEELRNMFKEIERLALELHTGGVVIEITAGSEQKVVNIRSAKVLSFEVKGTINQEL